VNPLKIKILSKNMREKPTNATIIIQLINYGKLSEDGNLIPKHVGATIHN
jgi:hypothetical protein